MKAVREVNGSMVPLDRADIDTDQIMPKQFLKRVERDGFGDFIFLDWRQDPAFVLNDPAYRAGTILVTGPNFGAGSSREHAAWGLQEYGFEAIIAPSFADIFVANATNIGLAAIPLDPSACRRLIDIAIEHPEGRACISLAECRVTCGDLQVTIEMDASRRAALMEGRDEIQTTLGRIEEILGYERSRAPWARRTTES